ncbi:MAG: hypothetical protein JWP12_3269 [Bacteroidetes bacterium]|nr:hypothetical protein [Bacteroidota bacterium]
MTYKSKKHTKIKMLIAYNFLLGLSFLYFVLYGTSKYDGNFQENLLQGSIIYCVILVVLIFLPNYWILKKRFYTTIVINNNTIDITDNNNKIHSYDLQTLAFSIVSTKFHDELIVYKKIIGTLGQPVFIETANFLAFKVNISWETSQLKTIAEKLRSLQVRQHVEKDQNFIDRIF